MRQRAISAFVCAVSFTALAARANLDDAWHHSVRGLGAAYWLQTDRFGTSMLQWNVELGQEPLRAGFSVQAGGGWLGRTPIQTRAGTFLGGAGLTGVWVLSRRLVLQLGTDFDAASNGPGLFIARLQARLSFPGSDDCGFEALLGPEWLQTLGSDPVNVHSGVGIAIGAGYGCRR